MPEPKSLVALVWDSSAFRACLVLLVAAMALSWVSWAIEFDFPLIPKRQNEQELGTPYDVRQGSCEPSRLRGKGPEADDARELCRRRAADYSAAHRQLVQSFRQTNAAEENLRLSWFQTRFGFLQVLLSTLAVVFTGWAAWAAASAARAASAANSAAVEGNAIARAAIAEAHRPWVTVKVTLLGTITEAAHGVSATVSLSAANVGQTPALEVDFAAELVAPLQGGLVDAQKAVSERFRQAETSVVPRNLFPGQGHTVTFVISAWADRLEPVKAQQPNEHGRKRLPLAVVGCVQYRASGSAERHQTGFIYEFTRMPVGNGPAGLALEDLPLSAEAIELTHCFDGDAIID